MSERSSLVTALRDALAAIADDGPDRESAWATARELIDQLEQRETTQAPASSLFEDAAHDLRKAAMALRLEVPAVVADDVSAKVEAFIDAAQMREAELLTERDELQRALHLARLTGDDRA